MDITRSSLDATQSDDLETCFPREIRRGERTDAGSARTQSYTLESKCPAIKARPATGIVRVMLREAAEFRYILAQLLSSCAILPSTNFLPTPFATVSPEQCGSVSEGNLEAKK